MIFDDKREPAEEAEFERIFNEITSETPKTDEPGVSEEKTFEVPAETADPKKAEVVPPNEEVQKPVVPVEANTGETSQEIDYKEAYERELQKTKSWEGRIKAANKRAQEEERRAAELAVKLEEAEKKRGTPQTPAPPAGMDDPILVEFLKDYPELVVPFEKLVQAKGTEIAEAVVRREMEKLMPKVVELETKVKSTQDQSHFERISKAFPGWEDSVKNGDIDTWIETQPTILKGELSRVATGGSTEEAIELLTMFYKDTKPKQTTPKPQKRPEDLVGIPASRSYIPQGKPELDDYDAAWKEATKGK